MKTMQVRVANDGGFTLIELLVAIGIITILTGIAIFSSGQFLTKLSATGASNSIAQIIMFAKSEATKQGKQVIVTIDKSNNVFDVSDSDSNNLITADVDANYKNIEIESIEDCDSSDISTITLSSSGSVIAVGNSGGSLSDGAMPVVISVKHKSATSTEPSKLVTIYRSGITKVYSSDKFKHKGENSACE
ncbi:MAG: pilus assembly FimT family protein [Nitrospinota bacterium]